MSWFENPVNLSAEAAGVLAAGMRHVALADGDIHQRELTLIQGFSAGAEPRNIDDAADVLDSEDLRGAYVRSLIMVALADGHISDAEAARIRDLAGAVGLGFGQVEALTLDVKRYFLQAFEGVHVFSDALREIAADLELPEAEVETL